MSQVVIYNKDNSQVYPEIQIAGETNLGGIMSKRIDNEVKFQLPVTITDTGYAYNGLNIIEVEEDGFFVVDQNMNAIFSSRNVISSTTTTNNSSSSPSTSPDLTPIENRLSSLESAVETIQEALAGVSLFIE